MVTTILKPVVFVIGQTIDILENYFPKIFLINLYITEAVVPGLMSGWCLGDVLLTTEGREVWRVLRLTQSPHLSLTQPRSLSLSLLLFSSESYQAQPGPVRSGSEVPVRLSLCRIVKQNETSSLRPPHGNSTTRGKYFILNLIVC